MGQEQGDIVVTDNVSATVTSEIRGTGSGDERPDYGTIRTTISSSTAETTSGSVTTFRMNTSDSAYPPDDSSSGLVELLEFAGDVAAHWNAVVAKLSGIVSGMA